MPEHHYSRPVITHRFYDTFDEELHVGDYVRSGLRAVELYQIKGLQYPAAAIILNVIPGGRLGTSTVPCASLTRMINNPPEVAPAWFDTRYEQMDFSPMPRTVLPCGCHLRNGDYQAILCPEHLIEANRP